MARSDIPTLLSLDQYAEILGLDPYAFNQMYCAKFPLSRVQNFLYYQHNSIKTSGRAFRDLIAMHIAEAEQLIADRSAVWPAPKYITDEQKPYLTPRLLPTAYPSYGRQIVHTDWKMFIAGGQRAVVLLAEDVDLAVSYEDLDGDGWAEHIQFSITVADASGYLPSEIAVFPADSDTDEEYRIRHVTVKIVGNTITITGGVCVFINPDLWELNVPINGDLMTSYLDAVDVYRVYTESNDLYPPAEFGWEDVTQGTAYATSQGVLQPVKPKEGLVNLVPAEWDATTGAWSPQACGVIMGSRPPDVVRYYYLAGWATSRQGRMCAPFDRAVAALATARLPMPISGGGESIDKIFQYWQEMPSADRRPSYLESACPFGQQRGALEAWRIAISMEDLAGFSV